MKKIIVLIFAVILNAFSQSLMAQTSLGMTAWGMSALNMHQYFDISLGMAFVILSVFAYIIACLIRMKFILREMIESFIFLFAFGLLTDLFIILIPDLTGLDLVYRYLLNSLGLLVLLFSIAIHLKVNRAIHPMDVFLRETQVKVSSVRNGTYIAYSSAFIIGIVFGLLQGEINGIHLGTLNVLLFSGLIFAFYTNRILKNFDV